MKVMLYRIIVSPCDRPVGGSGAGEGSGSGLGAKQLGEQMREFISAEITRSILDQTPLICGTLKERILELLDSRLEAFRAEIAAGKLGAPLGLVFMDLWDSSEGRIPLLALVMRDQRWVTHLVSRRVRFRIWSLWRFHKPYTRS